MDETHREIKGQLTTNLKPGRRLPPQECSYCARDFDPEGPLLCEVVRYDNRAGEVSLDELFTLWVPARGRCSYCETDTLAPGTVGFDEALVRIDVERSADGWCIKSTDIELVDYSVAGDGHPAPCSIGLEVRSSETVPHREGQVLVNLEAGRWVVLEWKLKTRFTLLDESRSEIGQDEYERFEEELGPLEKLPPSLVNLIESKAPE
ncbi:hypothetical protein ACFPYI_19000 [Halomarina salina]|uniref:Uncharacterized protein n=1 Tax=Halomarina salina TaxID=1872699 RepID=A0ABD5RRY4_9EURY|nr:hypothetical protein [Halomarina salina]